MKREDAASRKTCPMAAPLLVAVPADIREFETYVWHASPQTYLDAVLGIAGAVPVIVPARADRIDMDALLSRFDGVVATGSRTNVHPARYGVEPTVAHEPFDDARDRLSHAMITTAIARGMPVLAICRGHQELNVALGGSLATEIQEIAGRDDHRAPEHPEQDRRFAIRHPVAVEPGGRLEAIVGQAAIEVNSLHRQAIDRLAEPLQVEARAADGTIEAVSVREAKGFTLGVQWHPEYWAASDTASTAIFEAFGDACRAYRGS